MRRIPEMRADDALAIAEEGDEGADDEYDDGVEEGLRSQRQPGVAREGEMIKEERGEDDGNEAGAEAGEEGDPGDQDEAERQRRAAQRRRVNAEGDADPGKEYRGDIATDLNDQMKAARCAGSGGAGQIAASCNAPRVREWGPEYPAAM